MLGGAAAVEAAAKAAGHELTVPFTPGRSSTRAEHLLVDKAFMPKLSAPEMTALLGGLRVLGANASDSQDGVVTDRPGVLSRDFFVKLLDIGTEWNCAESLIGVLGSRPDPARGPASLRGQGLSGRVIARVVAEARRQGVVRIEAWPTRPWNEARSQPGAESTDEQLGFEVMGSEPDGDSAMLPMARGLA